MRSIVLLTTGFIGLGMTACIKTNSLRPQMTIQVKPAGSDSYVAQGQTNLPGKTTILVQAIRQLQPTHKDANGADRPEPVYAIVARRQVTTDEKGQWNTTLKVRQPLSTGKHGESWQQNFLTQKLPMQPARDLQFIATTSALPRNLQFEGDVAEGGKPTRPNPALQVNVDGSRFLRATQKLTVQPPTLPKQATIEQVRKVVSVPVQPVKTAGSERPAAKTDAPLPQEALVR